MYQLKDGFLDRGYDAVIITVWDHENGIHYAQDFANVRTVGLMLGRLLSYWDVANRTLAVGFSLGAHIVGEAGHYVQQASNGRRKIRECHGLDPAGPFFDGCSARVMLDKRDCELVQVLHSSSEIMRTSGPAVGSFGTQQKSGHCDFWLNCGYQQHPCTSEGQNEEDLRYFITRIGKRLPYGDELSDHTRENLCGHYRSIYAYRDQLRYDCKFKARSCRNHKGKDTCGLPHGKGLRCNRHGLETGFFLMPDSRCDPSMDENFFVASKRFRATGEVQC